KLSNLNSSHKIYSDFITFNTQLFQEKMGKYLIEHNATDAEKFAKHEIDELTVPEFIDETQKWKAKNRTISNSKKK
ncbi:MAG: hypothetical protein ACPG7E_03975, partial [Marinirhabdus sp.]